MVAVEVVRQDTPRPVAVQPGGRDGVRRGREEETLMSVGSVGGQAGRLLVTGQTSLHQLTSHLLTAVFKRRTRGEGHSSNTLKYSISVCSSGDDYLRTSS